MTDAISKLESLLTALTVQIDVIQDEIKEIEGKRESLKDLLERKKVIDIAVEAIKQKDLEIEENSKASNELILNAQKEFDDREAEFRDSLQSIYNEFRSASILDRAVELGIELDEQATEEKSEQETEAVGAVGT